MHGRYDYELHYTNMDFELHCTNIMKSIIQKLGFPGGSDGKESACNAGDRGSIPGLGRFPEEGNATYSSTLAWKIPWMEEPGRLQSMGSQRVGHD